MDQQSDLGFLKPPKRLNRAKLLQEAYEHGLDNAKAGIGMGERYDNPDLQSMFEEGWDKGNARQRAL